MTMCNNEKKSAVVTSD